MEMPNIGAAMAAKPEPATADEETLAEMRAQLWAAGLDLDESAFIARMLWRNGCRIVTWRPIETAPTDETQILAATEDGRRMIWSAEMLTRVTTGKTPFHLQFPATHWALLPAPPRKSE